jgi:hypothetical protein
MGDGEGFESAYAAAICSEVDGGPEVCKPMTTIDGWQREASAPMTGTAERRDTGFLLDFPRADPKSPHEVMSCTEQGFDVAPAKAIVIGANGCAPIKWSLPTERVKLLACASGRDATPTPFAASPGLEEVVPPSPDCDRRADRPKMYRRVAADASVVPALDSP